MATINNTEFFDPFNNREALNLAISRIEAISFGDQLTATLKDIAQNSGYECLAFVDYAPVSTTTYQQHTYGQFNPQQEFNLYHDDIYKYCKNGFRITSFDKLLASCIDVQQLYVLPLRGVPGITGALIFNIPKNFAEFERLELIDWYWTILSPYLLKAAVRCRKMQFAITNREKDCLLWASEGKTSWEISQILGISERTVNFHLTNCIEKTQSANRQQAIVKCVMNNII